MVLVIVIGVAVTHFYSRAQPFSDDLRTGGLVPGTSIAESSQSIRARIESINRRPDSLFDTFDSDASNVNQFNLPSNTQKNHRESITISDHFDKSNSASTLDISFPVTLDTTPRSITFGRGVDRNLQTTVPTNTFLRSRDSNFVTANPVKTSRRGRNRNLATTESILPIIRGGGRFVRPMLEVETIETNPPKVQSIKDIDPREAKIIRSWSATNSDGTFSYGYLNSDGSYKNETRGADCIVRGEFGYIDRETGTLLSFPYNSGNPCVPGQEPILPSIPPSAQVPQRENQRVRSQIQPRRNEIPRTLPSFSRPNLQTTQRQPDVNQPRRINRLQPIHPRQQNSQSQRIADSILLNIPKSEEIVPTRPSATNRPSTQNNQRQIFLQQKRRQEQLHRQILERNKAAENVQRPTFPPPFLPTNTRNVRLRNNNNDNNSRSDLSRRPSQSGSVQAPPPNIQQTTPSSISKDQLLHLRRHRLELLKHRKALRQQLRLQRLQQLQLQRTAVPALSTN